MAKKKKYSIMKSKALFHLRPSVPSPETNNAEFPVYFPETSHAFASTLLYCGEDHPQFCTWLLSLKMFDILLSPVYGDGLHNNDAVKRFIVYR